MARMHEFLAGHNLPRELDEVVYNVVCWIFFVFHCASPRAIKKTTTIWPHYLPAPLLTRKKGNKDEKRKWPHTTRTLEAEQAKQKKDLLITIFLALSDQQHVALDLVFLRVKKYHWGNSGLCHFRIVTKPILILGSESRSAPPRWHWTLGPSYPSQYLSSL